MNKRDYYEVLGLSKSATKQEIKAAYRKLAKEFHPDRNKASDAEEKFKEIQEAYEILSDGSKKQAYDQYGHAGTQGFGGASGTGGFEGFGGGDFGNINDIFSQFFGADFGGFGFGGGSQKNSKTRGNNLEMTLSLEFDEAIFGTEKTVKYKREIVCRDCKGTGAEDPDKIVTCSECKGSGYVTRVSRTFIGSIQTRSVCPKCGGEGSIADQKCHNCKGSTKEQITEEFKIKVPQGVPDNITLRYTEKGNAGNKGGDYGDLYVNIEVKENEIFERSGDDIYIDQEIDVITATLGGNIKVPTVHGEVEIKIPEGTQPGRVIRLKGKGAPKFQGSGNGDEYIKLKVLVPEKLSREEKKLWEEIRDQRR
ncbi:molecular chaperone DnaJ [Candidatus Dojkabacteria bacterium]|nr:molecular chaperone DnaJ [Candidatus Dojkabacteria bacterium]